MDSVDDVGICSMTAGKPAAILFQQQWRTYRKIVDNNYLFHREAYECLHRTLAGEMDKPFRFLDIACGDASSTVDALKGTMVAQYDGIDLSEPALQMAARNLAPLSCPFELHHADFGAALRQWSEPVDVVSVGLSLHHFRAPEKLDLMREIRRVVGQDGVLVLYENTSPDGECRESWMARWDIQRPHWTALSAVEWDAVTSHVHENDHPETASTWHELGRAAAFGRVRELFVAPTDLFRLYCFQV
ncbi:class I SAM-dependent methyltransferase [Mesorhizobium opportunistum]|uniref:Class I SAM-dependent methyltransferase n=2 Tax=Mesorhizobium TaxID=68287 RepID=A0ABV1YBS1_9HYPH|nr:class I SAM-dependent methyltransferase [Mesorhizobium sp.]